MWARVPSLMNASRSRFVLFVISRAGSSAYWYVFKNCLGVAADLEKLSVRVWTLVIKTR